MRTRLSQPERPRKVAVECYILREEHARRKLEAKSPDRHLMFERRERTGNGPKALKPAALHVEAQHLGIPALKDAMRGASVQLRQEFEPIASLYRA